MSADRLETLYLFLTSAALASFVWWVSTLPDDSRTFRITSKVLTSWFLSARWSEEPRRRLKRMAIGIALASLMMLYFLIADPPLRR